MKYLVSGTMLVLLSNGVLPRRLILPYSVHLVKIPACETVQYRFWHRKLAPPLLGFGAVFGVGHLIFILHGRNCQRYHVHTC